MEDSIPSPQPSFPFDAKRCSCCHVVKPLGEFHRDPARADGHTHRCKSCVRERGKKRRAAMTAQEYEAYRAAERLRGKDYRDRLGAEVFTERGRPRRARYRDTREEQARRELRQAVRSGRLVKPEHCEQCGAATDIRLLSGHHEDYGRPLGVVWLCPMCHGKTWRKARG